MKRSITSWPIRWTVRQLDRRTGRPIGEELPARVPGDVFSDLMAAGKIADPYVGLNSERVQWVNNHDWLYRGTAVGLGDGARHWLEFMGLDYRYAISWNGAEIFRGEGMFSRRLFEVVPRRGANNVVEVRFSGLPDRWIERGLPAGIVNTEPVRRNYLKTQMSFGWDFAPRLKGGGIWDEASLFPTGPALIRDVRVRTGNGGGVEVELEIDSSVTGDALLTLAITGDTFSGYERRESYAARLEKKADNRVARRLTVEGPRLWWPWDQGNPELYRLTAAVEMAGSRSDAADEVFGFREIGWARNPGSPKKALDWTLLVNGRRVFMRGANWVPPEAMAGRLTDERYQKLVEMARGANLNALRLWGGGNRERKFFYDACDRAGIMVWQEFPVACIVLALPRSRRFRELLRGECAEIVRQLRNHPSVVTWCGGNEFNVHLNRPAIKIMADVCRGLDPGRRFVPASPYRGDAHNWLVWHLKGNLSDYFSDRSQLVSEFGLQGPPDAQSLREFLPGELLWPIGKGWKHHHQGLGKMEKYARRFGDPDAGLDEFVRAGQEAQAHFLQRGIEHWRRHKYEKSGALIWQLSDPWPCISWSLVDYYLKPKRAYEAVRLAFQPLLVTAEFDDKLRRPGENFSARVFLVNDLPRSFAGVEVEVGAAGKAAAILRGDVAPDSVVDLGEVSFTLPDEVPPVLTLLARAEGGEISRNRYQLSFHDPERSSLLGRRLFRRWWQFLSE